MGSRRCVGGIRIKPTAAGCGVETALIRVCLASGTSRWVSGKAGVFGGGAGGVRTLRWVSGVGFERAVAEGGDAGGGRRGDRRPVGLRIKPQSAFLDLSAEGVRGSTL